MRVSEILYCLLAGWVSVMFCTDGNNFGALPPEAGRVYSFLNWLRYYQGSWWSKILTISNVQTHQLSCIQFSDEQFRQENQFATLF
jgi:hypothetical protein